MGGWHTPRWPSKKKGTHGNTRARTGGAASIAAGGPIAYHDCIRGLSRTLVTPCEPQSTQHGSRVPSSFSYPYRLFRACTVAPPRRRSSPGRPAMPNDSSIGKGGRPYIRGHGRVLSSADRRRHGYVRLLDPPPEGSFIWCEHGRRRRPPSSDRYDLS